jgi:hypothetical protein
VSTETQNTHADGPFAGYARPQERPPLASYAAFAGLFNGAMAAGLLAAKRSGHELPERIDGRDLVLTGVATHKLSRLVAKDKVTSFIRAPFTRYQESAGHGELEEQPRGEGLRMATGELLICPYCLGQWIASAFGVGLVGAPRFTRLIAFIYSAETVSDFLQLAYKMAEDSADS